MEASAPNVSLEREHFDEVLKRLRLWMPEHSARITLETRISEFGLSSIDFVELLCLIEEAFHVSLSNEDFFNMATVEDLARIIHTNTRGVAS